MAQEAFAVPTAGGQLVGWIEGSGPRVLLLHGGPGLSADYLDPLMPELVPGYRVALYQQRGLPPSLTAGPFDVASHVADVASVLDGLGWETAYIAGHSWGGHLAIHVGATMPDRLDGVLSIDPVGGVGDGGLEQFEATMHARTPEASRARAKELDERALVGEGTERDAVESFSLMWPAYFARPEAAPPPPVVRLGVEGYAASYESMVKELPRLEARLGRITVPVGFVIGASSPIPPTAIYATADRIPSAWVEEVPNAGHFLWLEARGSVRAALDRLVRTATRKTA